MLAAHKPVMSGALHPTFDGLWAWLTLDASLTDGYPMECATLGGLLRLCGC